MNTINKKIFIPLVTLVLFGGVSLGAVQVFAAGNNSRTPNIVQMIASRFGLTVSDVQSVFDQAKQQRGQKMEQNFSNRLDTLVKNGKITDAQKQHILAKFQELAANRQAEMQKLKGMTPAERKAEMQSQKQALQDWAKQNGIDLTLLTGQFGFRGRWLLK